MHIRTHPFTMHELEASRLDRLPIRALKRARITRCASHSGYWSGTLLVRHPGHDRRRRRPAVPRSARSPPRHGLAPGIAFGPGVPQGPRVIVGPRVALTPAVRLSPRVACAPVIALGRIERGGP